MSGFWLMRPVIFPDNSLMIGSTNITPSAHVHRTITVSKEFDPANTALTTTTIDTTTLATPYAVTTANTTTVSTMTGAAPFGTTTVTKTTTAVTEHAALRPFPS